MSFRRIGSPTLRLLCALALCALAAPAPTALHGSPLDANRQQSRVPARSPAQTRTQPLTIPGPAPAVSPAQSPGVLFVPVPPCRVADTRNPAGPFGGPELGAGATREFNIPQSACGIPSTAAAYSLNVTVVPNASLNYLTLWSTGQPQPNASTLNSDGRIKANAAITVAGTNGAVSVYVTDATHVILDIDGYFVPASANPALAFYPIVPCRIADTRNPAGPLGGPSLARGATRAFPVLSGNCGIPATAQAYSLNVTALPHKTLDYLTLWPTGEAQPNVSTLNSSTGTIAANAAIVPAGSSGDVSVFVSDDADVILDTNGYFAPQNTGGLSLYWTENQTIPCRVLDTRNGQSGGFVGDFTLDVETSACNPPPTAQAYVFNATAVPNGPLNYLTLWPAGEAQPNVSTLNAEDGAITSNMAIVPTGNGSIEAFASNPTNLILDLSSYFAPTPPVTSVSASCLPDAIQSGQTSQCSAVVQGIGNFSSAVSWTASAGSITAGGLYTAPPVSAATQVTVTATSTQVSSVSGSTTIGVNPAPDFSVSVSVLTVSSKMGTTSAPVTVSVNGLNGFSGPVSIAVKGLPAGIACSPSCPFTINANSSGQLSFVVPASAMTGSLALTVQGTSGSLTHSAPLTLDVTSSLQAFWNFWQNEALVSQNPASVTGKIFVSGWAFEGIPLTAVGVLVDGALVGNAFYGTARPDVLTVPGAFEDCGFSLALDTTKLSNGSHTVSVNATDAAGNVTAIRNYPNNVLSIKINVSNPSPTPTGPVANLTLNPTTTSLTVGSIAGYTATATNASGQPVAPTFTWSSSDTSVVKVTPTGAVLPLAAGSATISVAAGGLTQQVGVTVQAGSGTSGTIQVSIGPEEVVFEYNRDACMEGDYPDNPARAVRLGDGSLLLNAGSNPFYFADLGADFNSLARQCNPILVSTDSPTASTFLNRQWIFSLYSDGTTIHALVHNEFHDPIATNCKPGNSTDGNPCQYTSITYGASTDNGKSFTVSSAPQNLVAPPPAQWMPPAQGASPPYYGYQEPTNIVHAADGYYYARFGEFPPPGLPYYGGECLMRTQTLSDPASWRAWDGAAFELQMTDPYTNPPASICANNPSNVTVPYESLTFNTYLNEYMLVGLDADYEGGTPANCGFHFALSPDLVNWSAQQLIAPAYLPAPTACEAPDAGGLAGSFAYGSIIDPDDPSTNFETPGRTSYMYYSRFNDNTENRDLVRVPVLITKY